jgi:hypothetical protein
MRSALLALLALLAGAAAVPRNESRAESFARRAASREEKVRVIHGSGGCAPCPLFSARAPTTPCA